MERGARAVRQPPGGTSSVSLLEAPAYFTSSFRLRNHFFRLQLALSSAYFSDLVQTRTAILGSANRDR